LELSPTAELERLRRELAPNLEPIRLLSSGKMANVYVVRDVSLRRLVAVKVLSSALANDPVARGRFEREAHAVARLTHPNIVAIHSIGLLSNDVPYLVMAYIEGKTLADQLEVSGSLELSEAWRILADIAGALAAAHRIGIVHRDVRPANIILEKGSGRPVLTDFGIAGMLESAGAEMTRLTLPGEALGDVVHTSPEQLSGGTVTEAADIYSLGILAYELVTGKAPFAGASKVEVAIAKMKQDPPRLSALNPEVSERRSELFYRCLTKNPAHRPTADEITAALSVPVEEAEDLHSVLHALVRRRVAPIAALYLAIVWALLGFTDQLIDRKLLPEISYRILLGLLIGGLVATAILAWYHGAPGKQQFRRSEVWLLASAALLGLIITGVLILRG
jgi:serine/threonine protein kinase